jgi:hypothetical protein
VRPPTAAGKAALFALLQLRLAQADGHGDG